jgi:hypothetical protein
LDLYSTVPMHVNNRPLTGSPKNCGTWPATKVIPEAPADPHRDAAIPGRSQPSALPGALRRRYEREFQWRRVDMALRFPAGGL